MIREEREKASIVVFEVEALLDHPTEVAHRIHYSLSLHEIPKITILELG